MFHVGRTLLGAQFGDCGTFPASRCGYPRFFACAANESAKRFACDIEAGVGEPLPDLLVRLSRAQRGFNVRQKRIEEGAFRGGRFSGKFLQGVAVKISLPTPSFKRTTADGSGQVGCNRGQFRTEPDHSISRLAGSFSSLRHSLRLKAGVLACEIIQNTRLQSYVRVGRNVEAMFYSHLGNPGPEVARITKFQTVGWSSIYNITEADGRSYAPSTLSPTGTSTGTWTDANGNINGDGAGTLDTLGRTLVTQQSGTNQVLYSLYDSNGVQRTYTANTSTVNLSTNFNVIGDYNTHVLESGGSARVASSIVLPNNQSYQFQYENGTYGGLTQITLPTGGSVAYTWATFLDGARTYRYVASRTVNVGGHSYTWNFARSGTDQNITVDVTDPLGNHTVYRANEGAITSAKFYNGAASGNPLPQYVIDYDWDDDPWFSSASPPGYQVQNVGMRPIRVTTTLDNGQVSKKEFDYETISYT